MNTPVDEHASGPAARPLAGPDATEAPERLLQELARVAELLRASTRRDAAAVTAVVRLVPGLDLPRWQRISGQCDGWFALSLLGLGEDRPATGGPADENGRDPLTGMMDATAFGERLRAEAERARTGRRPLTLALFEEDGLDGLDRRATACAVRALSARLWEAAAGPDLLGRLQPGVLALALPGGGRFQALAVAERVVQAAGGDLAAQGLPCCLRAGVAPLDEGDPTRMLEQARRALDQAARLPGAPLRERVRLFRVDETPQERETLVLASEKQFLFFGGAQ